MKDKYLYFTFNGIKSSEFGCFYENTGEQLSFPVFPSFSDSIGTPMYQDKSYYEGTNITNRKWSLKCACDTITLTRFKELQKWLDIKTIGNLKFDFSSNFHYRVKVSSFSDVTLYPLNESKVTFHAEFTVGFTSVEDYAAISDTTYNTALYNKDILLDYDYRLPIIDYISSSAYNNVEDRNNQAIDWDHRFRLFNYQSYPCYPKLINNNTNRLQIKLFDKKHNQTLNNVPEGITQYYYNLTNWEGSTTYDTVPSQYNVQIDSQVGYAIDTNNEKILEEIYQDLADRQSTFINKGAFAVNSGEIKQHEFTLNSVTQEGTSSYKLVFLPNDSVNDLDDYDYGTTQIESSETVIVENKNFKGIVIQLPGMEDYLLYNEGEYGDGYYYVDHQYYFISYKFNVKNNVLEVILPSVSTEELAFLTTHVGDTLKLSICSYMEIEIKSQYLSRVSNDSSEISSRTNDILQFNLRTVL